MAKGDLVERLRDNRHEYRQGNRPCISRTEVDIWHTLCLEAADEIERLRGVVADRDREVSKARRLAHRKELGLSELREENRALREEIERLRGVWDEVGKVGHRVQEHKKRADRAEAENRSLRDEIEGYRRVEKQARDEEAA